MADENKKADEQSPRVKVGDLSRPEQELTPEEAEQVQGGAGAGGGGRGKVSMQDVHAPSQQGGESQPEAIWPADRENA